MTNRELKLELSKLAMVNDCSIDTAKMFYNWILEEPEKNIKIEEKPTEYDDEPIEKLAYRTRNEGAIIKRCKENGINTIGDLIRCGAHNFKNYHLVGRGLIRKIDDALEEYYNIHEWYLT